MIRLRFNVKDDSKIKMDEIKKTKGVMGAQFSGSQFQVIIGNDVAKVFDEVEAQLGTLASNGDESNNSEKKISLIL